ncbi:lysophospholipid acyltransferase family protein [Telmatospirillum sp.]|uniref:lysophospholipid acyltransferase family protein n=1 Tax=Telmatospirillum sp. TaxID=2079197 RepID=UPI00284810E7|nr:lysophospholipid acyltransferase family protein [Telmatospirillum sp.]MDR3440419.1 lysophospholipid acyltransferase family protein [Telmatospirillum sp.]
MHAPVTAAFRFVGFILWILLVVPAVGGLDLCGLVRACRWLARLFWRGSVRILGIHLVIRGTVCPDRPTLFVANHASYLDIVVLGAVVKAAFVAKKEVGQWPAIGFMAKLGRTVFIERRSRHAKEQKNEMITRLISVGESLILFPEGTSNDGNRVLPFKSALLSVAEARLPDGRPLPVQPISLAYTHLDGLPMGRGWRPFFAWYGDMELIPHLWSVLGLGHLTVEVDLHPAVTLDQFGSRKALTAHCQTVIGDALVSAVCGCPPKLAEKSVTVG